MNREVPRRPSTRMDNRRGFRKNQTTVTFFPAEDPSPKMTIESTLIIGKGYTVEEVVAILKVIIASTCTSPSDFSRSRKIESIAANHGITIP